ncbi:pseudouridine synthase [Zychaea mexicana]|uniref:pseudouridine synthase n=1 Tax=Zychaea mexicana TaxID=64656 RepID=UPI0022FE9DFD|nr:pseudouridine synthase [Zychaea mexicana]KAI9495703.1 pseudouridine synthase [Zychaea mexicana]
MLSKEKPANPAEAQQEPSVQAGQKRKNNNNKSGGGGQSKSAKKRFKTTKERRDHFQKNNAWSAKDNQEKPEADGDKEPRLPKKKVALLIGFNGTGYQGMQLNPNAKTIEDDIFQALCKAGAISKANADDPKKSAWMRAARTDKGVHAAGNVLSLKMSTPGDDVVKEINSHLPDQIRVWGYVVTKRSFHAKTGCDSRIYEYLLPSYAFMAPSPKELKKEQEHEDDLKLVYGNEVFYLPRSTPEEIKAKEAYRINEEDLASFREAMGMYQGTHNFHNYTIGRGALDKSCLRYIMSTKVEDPIYIDGVEWLSVKLHGQSFMLHQIRKMISMALLAVRSRTPLKIIENSFGDDRINIPKAPALGLLLERPIFGSYNRHAQNEKKGQTYRDEIDFEPYRKTIDAFKAEWIYKKLFEEERENALFDEFISHIDSAIGPDYSYLNSEGTIPKEALITTKFTAKPAPADDDDDA